ncbi:MarR family winged helix-turn-helix transcriptional regulator [Bacillus sp. NEB1478]|uniref:MarR family winged helix-turn-helix transcriptional regulator n=1 Tax=Bacillus sp. NEB1478 TaxID=3073816 RepID=UPI002872B84C|nr:MarR family winged helix-turn-helix transcriptional regulator [Bacillus sp. NEB1478]WNB91291.1 MarR family winged helix-turn-helix transcriptional regulator [Bacillus sp. NEB1478]
MEEVRNLLHGINRKYNLLLKNYCKEVEGNISLVHCQILFELQHHNQPSMQQVADLIGADITTFSRQIQSLMKADLVKKSANPDDKRIYFLTLTEKGKQTAEKIDLLMKESLTDGFSHLSEFERSTVMHSLKLVTQQMRPPSPL